MTAKFNISFKHRKEGKMRYLAKFLSLSRLGIVLYLGLTITSVVCADNLLINPGFEDGLNDWVDLYGFPSWLSSDVKHAGSYAAAKTIETVYGQDYWSQISQDVDYAAGQEVYITMWVKTDISPQARANAGVIVHFLDINGSILGASSQSFIGGQTDWRLLYVSGATPPETVTVRVSGYVWARQDDLRMLSCLRQKQNCELYSLSLLQVYLKNHQCNIGKIV